MTSGGKRAAIAAVAAAVAGSLLAPTGDAAAQPASPWALSYPAHHTVRAGENLKEISRHFLHDAYPKRPVTRRMVRHEVNQILILNDIKDPSRVQVGDRLLLARNQWEVPDGRVGWGYGFSWCSQDPLPSASRAPFDGWTATVRLTHPPLNRKSETAVIVVTNTSQQHHVIQVEEPRAQLATIDTDNPAAVYHSDAIPMYTVDLAPGEHWRVKEQVAAYWCRDTDVLSQRLHRGHYDLYGVLPWSTTQRSGTWRTPATEVRVTR